MSLKFKNESLYIIAYVAVFVGVSPWAGGLWRAALGLPVAFFLPGYSLVSAMFPARHPLDGWGRLALSFAFQAMVIPALGFAMQLTPLGLKYLPVLWLSSLLVLVSSVVAYYRRLRVPEAERFVLTVTLPEQMRPGKKVVDKALSAIVVISLLTAAVAFAFAVAKPIDRESTTEFYLLGSSGRAGDYMREVAVGKQVTTTLVVVNGEPGAVTFEVEMRVDESVQSGRFSTAVLPIGGRWQRDMAFVPVQSGNQKMEFLLYRQGETEPYRSVHTWLEVREVQ